AAVRDAMTAEERAAVQSAICARLTASDVYRGADVILSYVAIRSEVETRGIILHALAHNKTVAVPLCVGDQMQFYCIPSLDVLRPGRFGVPEPDPAACGLCIPTPQALCLVPGLAFDRAGRRLGYGAGFYDRYLASHPVIRLGLCADRCVASALPVEATDQTMDMILTESGFFAFETIRQTEKRGATYGSGSEPQSADSGSRR
ncbi:MAG: 5-formyltetrahydrofolate cyclo-ligase, partial [Clostridia bacterium]|nr:5-formyltetrahydrofolate cyclo-ligase [Clostridia bacterium]